MPTIYTPNPANNPATSTLPDPGDPVNAGVASQAWADCLDKDARKLDKTLGGTVAGDVVFNGTIDFGGTSIVQHDSGCTEEFDNTPLFAGDTTFTATATFSNTSVALAATGPVSISGVDGELFSGGTAGAIFATQAEFQAKVKLSSAGHVVSRLLLPAGTVDTTTSVAAADRVYYASLAADHFVKLTNASAEAGCMIKVAISPSAGAHNLQIKRDDNTVIGTLRGDALSGSGYFAECWHDGTNWFVADLTVTP
jgi:hypothetical protein